MGDDLILFSHWCSVMRGSRLDPSRTLPLVCFLQIFVINGHKEIIALRRLFSISKIIVTDDYFSISTIIVTNTENKTSARRYTRLLEGWCRYLSVDQTKKKQVKKRRKKYHRRNKMAEESKKREREEEVEVEKER